MNKLTNQQQNGFSTKQNNGNNHHHVQFVFDDVDRLHLPTNLYMPKNDSKLSQKQQKTNNNINTTNNTNHHQLPSTSWQMPLILPSDLNNEYSTPSLQKQLNNKTNGKTLTKNKKQKENKKKIFVQQYFITEHDPTISDIYIKNCFVDDVLYKVEVVDTAGQDEFAEMREPHFQTGDGFLLVFSVASRSSLEYMLKLREFIENYNNCKNLPMLLVGNKCDLELEREISRLEAEDLAANLKIPYIESSAKFRQNVDQIFHTLIRQIRQFQNTEQQQNGKIKNQLKANNNGYFENNYNKEVKQENGKRKKQEKSEKIKKSGICRVQ
uniref:Uncharacterized protein n=1 Tax=Meloidogyne enterolobii TaxID=390850 RepID=A0A6V7TPF5_MELEN|nr:unnamed protein product [Meloidogyne enterolobii]